MDTKTKQSWVTALRSGEFKQGRDFLNPHDDLYCCLGVLCKVIGSEMTYSLNGRTGITKDQIDGLIERNDGHGKFIGSPWSFEQIAEYIEQNF